MSSVTPTEDKQIYKGQDKEFEVFVAAPGGGMFDLTGCRLVFSIRAIVGGTPLITKDSDESGELVINADQEGHKGEAVLTINAADSTDIDAGMYYYDLWLTNVSSKTSPILTGYFWIFEVAPNFVDKIRIILDEGGEMRIYSEQNDLVNPRSVSELYLPRTRVYSVEGVWVGTDREHTGTNYFTGGGFDSNKGKVWLGGELPDTTPVLVDYTWESGIDNDAVVWHLHAARLFIVEWCGVEFEYGKTATRRQKAAEAAAVARAVLSCILTINGANVAQMGYNYRLSELEIQTKLWGEGMIAEALFNVYIRELDDWLKVLGRQYPLVMSKKTRASAGYCISDYLIDRCISPEDELSE